MPEASETTAVGSPAPAEARSEEAAPLEASAPSRHRAPVERNAADRTLDEDEVDELAEAFSLFAHEAGTLSLAEVGAVTRTLGHDYDPDDLARALTAMGLAKGIALPDFLRFAARHFPAPCDTDEELRAAFDIFDVRKRGAISAENLSATAHALGIDLSKEQLRDMMLCADTDRDGLVQFGEFKGAWEPTSAAVSGPPPPALLETTSPAQ